MKKILIIAVLAIGVASIQAQQSQSAFQLSLTPDIAIHPNTTQITAVSLDIWGKNPQHSFNLGFVNGSTGDSSGFSWAFLYNYSETYTGVQWAFVNHTTQSFTGWQNGLVNYDEAYFKGLQGGLVNVAEDTHGLQFGVVNYAETLNGVQIGLVNVIDSNSWFDEFPNELARGFPIVNWSF